MHVQVLTVFLGAHYIDVYRDGGSLLAYNICIMLLTSTARLAVMSLCCIASK